MDNLRNQDYRAVLEAVKDARYLLSRGYRFESVVQLVTARYMLDTFRKNILIRLLSGYNVRFRKIKILRAKKLIIDGYNVLITLSVILQKGLLVKSIDGLIRDVESKHGKNIKLPVMQSAVDFLETLLRDHLKYKGEVLIFLEKNISKSGELASYINSQTSLAASLATTVDLAVIRAASTPGTLAATSDSLIISRLGKVFPLTLRALELAKPGILITSRRVYFFD
jgi:hypothetical protein